MRARKQVIFKHALGQHGEHTLICCVVLQSVEALKKTLMLFWITMIWAGGKSTCENKSHINSKPIFLFALIWAGGKSTRENKSDIFSKPTFVCNKTVLRHHGMRKTTLRVVRNLHLFRTDLGGLNGLS